jgi:NAD(P)-dependent dehydrogenase (short-subunit alcohol dehydrogenase family)
VALITGARRGIGREVAGTLAQHLDALVNSAGVYDGPERHSWDVNVLGSLRLTRALAPLLAANARVVTVTSGLGRLSHGGFFGNNGVGGAQAEALRIRLADGTLFPLPVAPDDALMPSLLTLSDVMGAGTSASVASRRPPPPSALRGRAAPSGVWAWRTTRPSPPGSQRGVDVGTTRKRHGTRRE